MPISDQKKAALLRQMQALNVTEVDLEETFVTGSGKGGQKQNKTANCVVLKHVPTQTIIKCQKTRSREDNRFFARRQLCDQLDQQLNGTKSKKQLEIEKIRKKKASKKRKQNRSD